MLSMINIADPREIIVIDMTRVTSAEEGTRLLAIDQDELATSPLDEVIEPGVDRTFAALIAKDDFSATGALEYRDAAIDGQPTPPQRSCTNTSASAARTPDPESDRDPAAAGTGDINGPRQGSAENRH